ELLRRPRHHAAAHARHSHHVARRVDGAHRTPRTRSLGRGGRGRRDRHRRIRTHHGPERPGTVLRARSSRRVRHPARALPLHLSRPPRAAAPPGEPRPRRLPTRDPADRSIADASYPADEPEGFASVGEIFDDATNPGRKRPFAMRPVMQALIDQDGGWLEGWTTMAGAETAIVWDAHLGGHAVCLVGIESRNLQRLRPGATAGPHETIERTSFPLAA